MPEREAYQKNRAHYLAYAKEYYTAHKEQIKERRWERDRQPPRIAHCGSWHVTHAVPWHCPTCGYTLFLEGAEEGSHDE